MADRGTCGEGGGEDGTEVGSRSSPRVLLPTGGSVGTKRNLSRGIVIHLTGTEGEWDSLGDDELVFSLDHGEDYVSKALPKERLLSAEDEKGLKWQNFFVPLSPSSPGSLGNCSAAGPSFLSPASSSPGQRPPPCLVKSLSTELEPKEGSTLRPKPFLNLVKSISTELSRSEPEVSQSRSDSRLNLHLWKQLTRTGGDSRTAPPSPSALSPSAEGLKGGFFKMELEDTKRKLSEAMHEPLSSMLSKIMGEEGGGSPKHQSRATAAPQSGCRSLGRDGSTDTVFSDSPVRRADAEVLPVFEWPSRVQRGLCPVHHPEEELEICSDGDTMQVFAVETLRRTKTTASCRVPQPPPPLPQTALLCVALLAYGYFTLPLSPYLAGLALGLALGFLLGLFLIRIGSCGSDRRNVSPFNVLLHLQGWMNEIHDYDPETCHPALTQSIFATLEGSCLRLDSPRTNISRRATHDERLHETAFIKSRCFQLAKSKVFLLPPALARKRVWNPKYPICIQLHAGGGASPGEEDAEQVEKAAADRAAADRAAADRAAPIRPASTAPVRLFLFGRTGREKEEWFHHLLLASKDGEAEKEAGSSDGDAPSSPAASRPPSELDFPGYMARLLAADEATPLPSPPAGSAEASPTLTVKPPDVSQTAWANAFIGRVLWDFLREKHWADAVSHKIQKKLSRIRLPYFMNELTLTELDMGRSVPQILAVSRPQVNHRALLIFSCVSSPHSRPVLSVLADSDEESSSAASSDEEELLPGGGKTGRKILRFVDKIAKSKCFQRAAESEFIKKKFEEMSNTPLLLSVEVRELSGTLVVNIPAPPTDRIWYSFCVPPKLDLHVCPKLGEREVTFCHVTEWIEKKLQDEFQRVFVLPNMDDIYLPLMHSGMDYLQACKSQSSSSESVEDRT
uniref:Testis expressed 2, like n=1 Tax=Fundulus heteroclitus TaxID=8078 RepID=A0A3Q2PM15_FUNHE